ncbi:hypothetical protein HZA87_00790, partial [Candidatus Uhrbacteria bacterium]|nr:hypothetical protein [Candidatus Uhrbacteria bacterium]
MMQRYNTNGNEGERMESLAREGKISRRTMLTLTAMVAAGAITIGELMRHGVFDAHHDDPEHARHAALEALLGRHFREQQPQYTAIAEQGLQGYFDALGPEGRNLFWERQTLENHEAKECALCSDEGNEQALDAEGRPMHLVRLPGSGVPLDLRGLSPFSNEILTEVATHMNELGIDVFTGHDFCGAMKAVLRQWLGGPDREGARRWLQEQGRGNEDADSLTWPTIDTFARIFAIAVTNRMRQLAPHRAQEISSRQIRAHELHRPTDEGGIGGHITQMLQIDGRNRHAPHADLRHRMMPPTLVISAKNEQRNTVISGAKLLFEH